MKPFIIIANRHTLEFVRREERLLDFVDLVRVLL
jgi:hypothetical protein